MTLARASCSIDRSPSRRPGGWNCLGAGIALSVALAGCTGLIGEVGTGGTGTSPDAATPLGGDTPPGRNDDGSLSLANCPASDAPNPVNLRRLSNLEYINSVRDLLGGIPSGFGSALPADSQAFGFDNNAESAPFTAIYGEAYRDMARAAADWVMADATRRSNLVGCTPTAASCLPDFALRFAQRAYRRPLSSSSPEVRDLVTVGTVAADDPDPYMRIRLVIAAALRSSDFLYRVEFGGESRADSGAVKLLGAEVATRLSYLVLRTAPSPALMAAAARGELDSADGVATQLQAMLATDAGRLAMRRFFAGWFGLDNLAAARRETTEYPKWSSGLRDAMREETLRLTEEVAWGASGNMLDLLTSRSTWVNGALADLYGLPAAGTDWRRVELPASSGRAGVLTHASVLTATSADHEVLTVIRRGKWVRDAMMCDALTIPPEGVPALMPALPGQSVRAQLAVHRQSASCAGCHDKMDPVGFGLSAFDEIGAARTRDERGEPIDTRGAFTELEDGAFANAVELAARLRAAPRVPDCMVQQAFRYTFGRGERASDTCAMARAAKAFRESNYNFRQMLLAYVRSDAFRYRPAVDAAVAGGAP